MKLIHAALFTSSRASAESFYHDLLGLSRSREYSIPAELTELLFGLSRRMDIILYEVGDASLEVFMFPDQGDRSVRRPIFTEHGSVPMPEDTLAKEAGGQNSPDPLEGTEPIPCPPPGTGGAGGTGFMRPVLNHVCLSVEDREGLVTRAMEAGYWVIRNQREGKPDLVFLYDRDGNPFELQQE